jgi:hypothetical protein
MRCLRATQPELLHVVSRSVALAKRFLSSNRSVNGADAQLELLLNLSDRGSARLHLPDGLAVEHKPPSAATELDALLLSACHACPYTFTDEVVIELSQRTEHVEEKLSGCRSSKQSKRKSERPCTERKLRQKKSKIYTDPRTFT